MIFLRSTPDHQYRNYIDYRLLLRRDFQNRCAYCLVHEYFLGGEAGCCIDHHRPIRGVYARPDLVSDYNNLYWSCRECNENKGSMWPNPEDYAAGLRFIDPCNPIDDHDLHLRILPSGAIEPLSLTGSYTIRHLKLWRPLLQHHRARSLRLGAEAAAIERSLGTKNLDPEHRTTLEHRLAEMKQWLEPQVFDRPR